MIGLLCFLLAGAGMAEAGEVTAKVDRAEVVEGETITLILQTNDTQQSLAINRSGLEQDFDILEQRSETQMSIANGRQRAVVRLLITLEPKRSGELLIPAMAFGDASTAAIRVTVKPAPELAEGEIPPVFIEVSLDPAQGPYYVHAQLALTVRIFYQQNLTEAAINPPAPQQASVRLLDEIPFQSTRNGIRYRVLERHYAIFPERSGELEIPPLVLSGRLIERPADRLWRPSVRGRRVKFESEPLTILVLPKPALYQGAHWLPARRITLSQQISNVDGLQVGEPVTRTIILDAVGLEENMLEEPVWPETPNARIYPDQPQGISRNDGQWVLGHKEFRYAVVPEEPGELVLPEIHLDWWDTHTNQARTAKLPEHRVEVAASKLVADISTPAGAGTSSPGLVSGGIPDPAVASALLRWRLLALAFAALWLVTLALLLRRRARKQRQSSRQASETEAEAMLLADLKHACKANDATQVRKLFRRWLRLFGPAQAYGSTMAFAAGVDDVNLQDAIHRLDASGFSGSGQSDWAGSGFWKAFSNWLESVKRMVNDQQAEPDLYAHC